MTGGAHANVSASVHGCEHDRFGGGFLRREFFDDSSLPRNEDAVREAEDLRQIGGYDDDGEAVVSERADQLVDFRDGADVDAARRLVENNQLGILNQGLGDHHFLLIAAGKLDDRQVPA